MPLLNKCLLRIDCIACGISYMEYYANIFVLKDSRSQSSFVFWVTLEEKPEKDLKTQISFYLPLYYTIIWLHSRILFKCMTRMKSHLDMCQVNFIFTFSLQVSTFLLNCLLCLHVFMATFKIKRIRWVLGYS